MGKRRTVVVISTSSSSSSEENDGGRGSSGSRSRSASISRRKPRKGMTKRGRVSNEESMKVKVEFDILSEDFSECLNDFNLMSGLTTYDRKELWVDKHKPRSLADLAVHKKKVEEVKKWLDERVKISKPSWGNHTLVLTGQAGVGKSATIHVIASELGAVLYEWTTPTPTLWQEHVHNVNSGVHYISKLEEFENFVEKIRKYSLLQSISSAEPRKPIILLIDDIPMTNGRVAFVRLRKCLTDLTRWTQVPTIILITQCHKTESTGSSAFCWEEVESSLQGAGAHKVTFNPVTVNSIKKSLVRICKEEKCDVTAELIDQIAKASGGDIRHAITSLQYYTIKPECCPFSGSTLSATQSELKSNKLECSLVSRQEERSLNCMVSFPYGKDETLTLFHALGKFLHNKRLAHDVVDQVEPDSYTLQEKLRRNPLKMDDPEKVLSQAHGQARSVVEFLYENVLDFINDDAVESASLVISYISDADCLLASNLLSSSCLVKNVRHESESLAHGIATSVAVRGVLFGNSQPSPSRWHTIRSPRVWQIEQSFRFNKDQMLKERFENIRTSGSYMLSDIATDFRPTAKYLTSQKVVGIHTCEELLQDDDVDDYSDWSNIDNSEGMNSDNNEEDDIEDW